MDIESLLKALAAAAGAPGQAPQGSSPFVDPFGFNPFANKSLAPVFQQSSEMQMLGTFLPMIVSAIDPKLGASLQQMSNINPALSQPVQRQRAQNAAFTQVGQQSQTKALQNMATSMGMDPKMASSMSEYLPIAQAFMPGLGNAISRFDISGAGFGFSDAMGSVMKATAFPASQVNGAQATAFAKEYMAQWQREGTGGLAGQTVLDYKKTSGQTVAEMAQTRASLETRGIVGSAFAGTNDVNVLKSQLGPDKLNTPEAMNARTVEELSKAVGPVALDEARSKQRKGNLAGSAPAEEKWAKALGQLGGVFTDLQGNSEALMREAEKLTGTLDKMTPEKIDGAIKRYTKLMERSGLGAGELSKAIDAWSARTGNNDRAFGGEVIARMGGAQAALAASGVSSAQMDSVANAASRGFGTLAELSPVYAMAGAMTDSGKQMLSEAEAALKPGSGATDEKKAWAKDVIGGKRIAEMVKPEDIGTAQATMLELQTPGAVSPERRAAMMRHGAKGLGITADEMANRQIDSSGEGVLTDIGSALDAATVDLAKLNKELADAGVDGLNGEEVRRMAISAAAGDDAMNSFVGSVKGKLGGEKAAKLKELMYSRNGGVGELTKVAQVTGGVDQRGKDVVTAVNTAKTPGNENRVGSYKEDGKGGWTYTPNSPATALIEMMEKDGGKITGKGAFTALMKGMGVVGSDEDIKLTNDQAKMFDNSALMKDLAAARDLKDPDTKTQRLNEIYGGMQEAWGFKTQEQAKQYMENLEATDPKEFEKKIKQYETNKDKKEKKEGGGDTPPVKLDVTMHHEYDTHGGVWKPAAVTPKEMNKEMNPGVRFLNNILPGGVK